MDQPWWAVRTRREKIQKRRQGGEREHVGLGGGGADLWEGA